MTGDSTYDSHPGSIAPYSISAHREGVIGGGQIGYNYQLYGSRTPHRNVTLGSHFAGRNFLF